jgi:small subunit ribosomal protein S16
LAVRIRLTRVGATKRPAYRIIAIDRRRSRDGRALEILGYYDPLTEPATVKLDTERINTWIGNGAQPSETVAKLMRIAAGGGKPADAAKPSRATRAPRTKASAKTTKPATDAGAAPAATKAPPAEAPTAEEPAGEAAFAETPADAAEAADAAAPAPDKTSEPEEAES